jgi:hypothetical protein
MNHIISYKLYNMDLKVWIRILPSTKLKILRSQGDFDATHVITYDLCNYMIHKILYNYMNHR